MRRTVAATGLVLALACSGAGCTNGGRPTSTAADPSTPATTPSTTPAATPATTPTATARATDSGEVADPTEVSLPRLDLEADLRPLRLGRSGELHPPPYGIAGWYAAGPEPGEQGAAVIAGHLDSKSGPDVFARLGETRRGDRIVVRLEDGKSQRFVVTSVEQFAQRSFPTRRVYGATKDVELRLITCGGNYDRRAGRYLDNVVVFARAAG